MTQSFSCIGYIRRLLPFLLALGLILFNAIPAYPVGSYLQSIPYVLTVIFYFSIFHPSVLNDCMVFVLSVLADMLVQGPFGLIIVTYVSMFFLAHFLRSYLFNLNFFQLWGVFGIFLSGILGIQYLLFCLTVGQWMPFTPHIIGGVVLILTYPFIMRICAFVDTCVRGKI